MMSGYLGGPALESESWFKTGDLGYCTDDGLVMCGRAKEVITKLDPGASRRLPDRKQRLHARVDHKKLSRRTRGGK